MAVDWVQVGLVVLALAFVGLNGFFVAAEFAIVKVRSTQIAELERRGARGARHARIVVDKLNEYLNACQLGITLASLALGWIGEPAFARLLEPLFHSMGLGGAALHTAAFGLAFGTITVLHIVLGEIVPKTVSIQAAETVSLWLSRPLTWFYWLFHPIIWALNHLSFLVLRPFGIRPGAHEVAHSEEELRLILAHALSKERADVILNVFDLRKLEARHVMTARGRMVVLDVQRTFEENVAIAEEAGYTRFPLVDGHLDNVVGMVHFRDLVRAARLPRGTHGIHSVRRDVLHVPETTPVERLLSDMLRAGRHMAVVFDEFGATAGVVTMEDIFEELFGEIRDEFDIAKAEQPYRTLGDRHWLVDSAMPLHEASELLGMELAHEGITTLGGYVAAVVGHLPAKGERLELGPYEAVVREADRKRIKLLEIWHREAASTPPGGS